MGDRHPVRAAHVTSAFFFLPQGSVVTKPPVFNFSLDIKDEGDIRRLQSDSFLVIATNSAL
jgi:hypothetical protein